MSVHTHTHTYTHTSNKAMFYASVLLEYVGVNFPCLFLQLHGTSAQPNFKKSGSGQNSRLSKPT